MMNGYATRRTYDISTETQLPHLAYLRSPNVGNVDVVEELGYDTETAVKKQRHSAVETPMAL